MINSASGYECLNVTGLGSFITGAIMPTRQGGAKRVLKYEDLLFLKEAWLERHNWREKPATKESAPGRVLDWVTFNRLFNVVGAGVNGKWINKGANIEEGITALGEGTAGTITGERMIDEAVERAIGSDIEETGGNADKRRLLLSDLEQLYERMKRLKRNRIWAKDSSEWITTARRTWTRVHRWHYDEQDQLVDDGESNENYSTINQNDWPSHIWYGDIAYSEINQYNNIEKGSIKLPWVKKAWMVMGAYTHITTDDNNGYDDKGWLDLVVKECAIRTSQGEEGGKEISWDNMDFRAIMDEVAQSHGESLHSAPARVPDGRRWEVTSLSRYTIVVDHDFPATPPEES